MIARIKGFDLEIAIDDNHACVIVIKRYDVFRSIVKSISDNINGITNNDFIILENENQLNYEKEVIIINDYLNLNVNSREIQTKLYKLLETNIHQNFELQQKIEYDSVLLIQTLYEFSMDLDFKLSYNSDVSIINLLKTFSFRIDTNEVHNTLEELFLFIDIVKQLKIYTCLLLVNLKSNFDFKEIEEIYKYLHYKKLKFLCIETTFCDKIELENVYLIDEDLVEFDYSK